MRIFQCLALVVGLQLALFQAPGFATTVFDAAKLGQNIPTFTPENSLTAPSLACNYNATDTYMGPNPSSGISATALNSTEATGSGQNVYGPGYISMPAPPMTDTNNNLVLSFRGGSWSSTSTFGGTWTSTTPSPLKTPVPCTGTYQIFFSLQVQPTYYGSPSNPPPAITFYPCVQTTDGLTTVYGGALSGGACPTTGPYVLFKAVCNGGNYCSVITFQFSTQVHLTAGQIVGAPVIHASNQMNVTGGEFNVFYVGP